ncbi:hypothetical protein Mapa_006178 [Marchantia paleacea]|nr:hypothetical protein Mapa_006178 [Marchantia paleacea]
MENYECPRAPWLRRLTSRARAEYESRNIRKSTVCSLVSSVFSRRGDTEEGGRGSPKERDRERR